MLFAEQQPEGGAFGGILGFLPIILLIALMYFLLIRPSNKRRREQLELQARLAPGDEIRTVGGLYGTIVATDTDTVTIQAAPGVELRYARAAIDRVITKTDEPAGETTGESDADGSTRS